MRPFKAILILLLLVTGKAAFSSPVNKVHYGSNVIASIPISNSIASNQAPEVPSHGCALLILRYKNEAGKKKLLVPYVVKNIDRSFKLITEQNNSTPELAYLLSYPEKTLRYEVFLYSLPLRSPPVYC